MTIPSLTKYFQSLAAELASQSDRVRDLIGDAHWLTDGHHKEYLLISLLNRHLPKGLIATRGFVIDPHRLQTCSREQDILIADISNQAPLFSQGDVAVVFPSQVRAAISVKTTFAGSEVKDSIDCFASVADILATNGGSTCWYGAYFFTTSTTVTESPTLVYKWIQNALNLAAYKYTRIMKHNPVPFVDFLCCTGEFAFKRKALQTSSNDADRHALFGKHGKGFATALFLADLIDHVATQNGSSALAEIAKLLDDYELPVVAPGILQLQLKPKKPAKRKKVGRAKG